MENQITQRSEAQVSNVQVDQNPFVVGSTGKVFEVIEQLNKLTLVTPNEVSTLEKAQSFLLSTYTDVPSHRTYMDKCVGVLTNSRFPTPDAKFWQCKKEAEVQFYELMRELMTYKKTNITMKELLYKKEKAQEALVSNRQDVDIFLTECDIERFDVAILETSINLKKIEKEIKFRIVEIGDWLAISKEWEPEMKHSKDIYGEHHTEALYRWIESQMNEAKARGDEKTYDNFADQLQTLQSLLKRKMQTAMKSES
jgi:hypothetical protein